MISLIITTCDRPAFLKKAIESALTQKYVGEIIVIDDGHVPPGELAENVRLIKTNGYIGICAVRNLGLNAASLPYIAYLDDDDLLYPDAYLGPMDAFKAGAHNVVVSNVDRFEDGGKVSVRVPPSTEKGTIWGMDIDALQGGYSFFTKQSAVYEAEFLRLIGGWEERLKSRSQSELFLRISQKTDITGINCPCYRLNRSTSYEHLTDGIRPRFRSYVFLIIRHSGLWTFRKNGWRWFVRETRYIERMIRRRYFLR